MSADDLTLAELLCARLCHDLAGAVGAAAAGAELLEDGFADTETIQLVAASAGGAAARLKFLRAAFGPATQSQPTEALRDLVAAHLASSAPAPALEWRVAAATLPPDAARLLLNLVLVARDALPKGGRVAVSDNGAGQLTVAAYGAPAQLADEARIVLVDGGAAQGPRGGQAHLVRLLAQRSTGGLAVAASGGAVEFRALPRPVGNSHPDGQGSF